MKNLTFLFAFFFFVGALSAQYLQNPSFEGEPIQNLPPPGWQPCDPASSPDTQPGVYGVTLSPAEGQSYLSLVSRGSGGPFPNRTEDVTTALIVDLKPGIRYRLHIQLAFSPNFGHELPWNGQYQAYDHPLVLEIWGGSASCDREVLLWQSPPVSHPQWQGYEVSFENHSLLHTLTLSASWAAGDSFSFGNLLIDDLTLEEAPASLMLPNVFTPNDDGIQDVFCPFALEGVSRYRLQVYDRWGKEVFFADDPLEGWNGRLGGRQCPEGVYFWATEYANDAGEIQRQFGSVMLLR